MTFTSEGADKKRKVVFAYLEVAMMNIRKAQDELYHLEDQTRYEIKEISECIEKLEKIDFKQWKIARHI